MNHYTHYFLVKGDFSKNEISRFLMGLGCARNVEKLGLMESFNIFRFEVELSEADLKALRRSFVVPSTTGIHRLEEIT